MALLVVLGIVGAATALLLSLRRRELGQAVDPTIDRSAPLSPREVGRLRRWERRLRRAFLLVAVAYLGLVAASLVGEELSLARSALALALLALACSAAVTIQFSERCPRCRYNLGFQSRLDLPASCERCGGRLS